MSHDEITRKINWACLRKSNLTEEAANSIIDFHLKTDKKVLYYYKCPFCSSIHLTSSEPHKTLELEVI